MIACYDIGGTFIRYGLPDGSGMVPEKGRAETPKRDFEEFVLAIRSGLVMLKASSSAPVSISLCGSIDPDTGIATVANVPCVNGLPLVTELSRRLGRDVYVTNDADCFALAEAGTGVAKGHANVFAVILGSGVGGGLLINHQLVGGAGGFAGEWGHGPIVDPGAGGLIEPMSRKICGCGRTDCLDPVGSARGLEHLHMVLHGEELSSSAIVLRFQRGEQTANSTVKVYVENLARVLGLIINVTGVSIVPVGGGLSTAPILIAAIDKRVRELTLAHRGAPLVVPGVRSADGGLIGAAIAAQSKGAMAA